MEEFVQPHEENATIELDALIEVYEVKGKLNDQSKKDLEILKLSRNYNIKDLSKKLGINTSKLKFIITRCVGRMRKFALHGVEHGNKN